MAILGSILKKGIKLSKVTEKGKPSAEAQQWKQLKNLLAEAKNTQFGKKFGFKKILKSPDALARYKAFKQEVPIYNYNRIYNEWWHRCKEGEKDVVWPGSIKYFALSSGTSEASSKYIPLTKDLLKANKNTGIRQIKSLSNYDLPNKTFTKGILMLGGSTDLNRTGHYYEGDLSGIQVNNIPFWFHTFYKPGKEIARNKDWTQKLKDITLNASKWDIGYVVGVPAWIQLMMEDIIAHYKVSNIHDIWPNLEMFVHGGVAFDPYRKSFERLLGRPINYIETYLASEGFIALQTKPNTSSMSLVLDNGLFYEFVPFNSANFDDNGDLLPNVETLTVAQVEAQKDYAILLSTCGGAWRYLIGDVIRFTDVVNAEIIITGRTKHFLSLCGEHLSIDNMNKAIKIVSEKLNISIPEYTVAGVPFENMFAHKWYIGIEGKEINATAVEIREILDASLKEVNDDYKTERISALKDVIVHVLPSSLFYKFMKVNGKEGGQHKFPRVTKKSQLADWENFLSQEGYTI